MPDPTDTAASTQASETRPGEHVRFEFVLPDAATPARASAYSYGKRTIWNTDRNRD